MASVFSARRPRWSADELRARADALDPWFHSIDLGHGVVTHGKPIEVQEKEWAMMDLGSLEGRSYLDVAGIDGWYVTGRLRHLPRARVQVLLQARDGRPWRTIGQTRTRADGRFTWRYRFKRSARGRRFALRARVDSPNYPFSTGYSRRLAVRVR